MKRELTENPDLFHPKYNSDQELEIDSRRNINLPFAAGAEGHLQEHIRSRLGDDG